jgi:prophage DNA circulation protein
VATHTNLTGQVASRVSTAAVSSPTLTAKLANLVAKGTALVNSKLEYANAWFDVFATAAAAVNDVRERVAMMRDLFYSLVPPLANGIGTRTIGAQLNTNQQAQAQLVKLAALAQWAVALSQLTPDSVNEAGTLRRDALAAIDLAATRAADSFQDALFDSLQRLAATVSQDLTTRGGDLVVIRQVVTKRPVPALVLVYRETASLDTLDDFLTRNAAEFTHPGFTPPLTPLQLLPA